jgi:hypothetical protein
MLTIKVMSFDIGYNYILERSLLLKFKVVIHTAYATMKMTGLKGVITIKADQWDALACENASLSHVGRFNDKTAQDQSAKVAKTQGGNVPHKASTSKPPTGCTLRSSIVQKGVHTASVSNQLPTDQKANNK